MFFLFYKFLFFFSYFLEIQRKSFYLFLNKKLGEEFSKIQPLHSSQKWTLYKNSKELSTKENLSLQTKNFIKSSNKFLNQNKIGFHPYRSLTHNGFSLDPVSASLQFVDPCASLSKRCAKPYNVRSQKIAITRTKDRIITIDFLYQNYKFIQPTLSIAESILFSKTYCCHFYFPVRLFDHLTNNLVDIRWVFLGTLPLLTRRGHFIINGTPRVVLNQIIRSPGIYFHKETTEIKKNSRLFYAEVISKSGPWIRIEIDYKKKIWIVFQQSRISLSYFFQNFDQKFLDHQLFLYEKKKLNLNAILSNEFFASRDKKQHQAELQDLKKNILNTGIFDQYCIARKSSRCQKKNVLSHRNVKANSKFNNLYEVLRKYLKFNWNLGRLQHPLLVGIAAPFISRDRAFTRLSRISWLARDTNAFVPRDELVSRSDKPRALVHNGSDEPNIRLNFFPGKSGSQFTKSKQTFSNILFASSIKDTDLGLNLGRIGRIRLNKRLGLSLQTLTLTPMDFFAISDILYQLVKNLHGSLKLPIVKNELAQGKVDLDDIDDLKNRRLKTIGELLQNQLTRGLLRLQKTFENSFQKDWIKRNQTNSSSLSFLNFEKKSIASLADRARYSVSSLRDDTSQSSSRAFVPRDESSPVSVFSLLNHLPINSTFKEFFHSHQLSQYLDQSNPLAEITHKRRFSCLGSGGINRETAGMEIRGIHLSHYGRICPIETPEGKNAGLVNSLTTTVNVNNNGFLETPYIEIYKQHLQNHKKFVFFSVESQEKKNVFLNPKSPKLHNITVGIIQPQTKNFYKCTLNVIQLMAFSPQQFLSIATTCIPFIEHDDANRALMGSNMQRQALPLIHLEQPIVTTLNAFRVLSDLKDIPTTSNSGVILYASQQKISFCLNLYSKPRSRKLAMFPSVYIQSPFLNSIASCIASRYPFAPWDESPLVREPNNPMSSLGSTKWTSISLLNREKQKSIQQTISFFKDRKKF